MYTHMWPGEDDRTREAVQAAMMRRGFIARDDSGTEPNIGPPEGDASPSGIDSGGAGEILQYLS